jgi:hypothetical protein
VSALSRREVLAATGLAVSVSLGGCLLRQQGPGTGHADPVVAAWYRVPEGDAVEFQNVIEPGQGYEVRAALPDAPPADRTTGVVDPCSGDPAGERVVSVRIRPDGSGSSRGAARTATRRAT